MRLVVVGSGIVGSACAYVASSLGAQVTLIDAARPGQATAAGAGIICPWTSGGDDPAGYALACAAARALAPPPAPRRRGFWRQPPPRRATASPFQPARCW